MIPFAPAPDAPLQSYRLDRRGISQRRIAARATTPLEQVEQLGLTVLSLSTRQEGFAEQEGVQEKEPQANLELSPFERPSPPSPTSPCVPN